MVRKVAAFVNKNVLNAERPRRLPSARISWVAPESFGRWRDPDGENSRPSSSCRRRKDKPPAGAWG